MGRQDSLDAAEAISVFDFGVEDLFVPMASGILSGSGLRKPAQATSGTTTPSAHAESRGPHGPGRGLTA